MPVAECVSDYLDSVISYVQEILREYSDHAFPAINQFRYLAELDPAVIEDQALQKKPASQKIHAVRIYHDEDGEVVQVGTPKVKAVVASPKVYRVGGRRKRLPKSVQASIEEFHGRGLVQQAGGSSRTPGGGSQRSSAKKSLGEKVRLVVDEEDSEDEEDADDLHARGGGIKNVVRRLEYNGSTTKANWTEKDDLVQSRSSQASRGEPSGMKRKSDPFEFEASSLAKAGPSGRKLKSPAASPPKAPASSVRKIKKKAIKEGVKKMQATRNPVKSVRASKRNKGMK
jgi:hypothetical protein